MGDLGVRLAQELPELEVGGLGPRPQGLRHPAGGSKTWRE